MATKKKETLKLEDKELRDYELVYIISLEVPEESVETVINNVSQFITSKEGVISNVEQWGRRRLAFPIKHFNEGYYVLARFQMSPVWSKELEASLEISEEVIRHLLIKLDS